MIARLIRKRKRSLVVITCDNCGQDNVFKLEHFLRGYVSGQGIYCKYCGQELAVMLSDELERKVEAYRRKKGGRR